MPTLEKHTRGLDSERLGLQVQIALLESEPLDSLPARHKPRRWEERFWNPLAQAHQSEEELWAFLGNWDL
jgi:hypothetical protein